MNRAFIDLYIHLFGALGLANPQVALAVSHLLLCGVDALGRRGDCRGAWFEDGRNSSIISIFNVLELPNTPFYAFYVENSIIKPLSLEVPFLKQKITKLPTN